MSQLNYTLPWGNCPACKGVVRMHIWPDMRAGVWHCKACGLAGRCTHKNTEQREIAYYRPTQEQVNNGTDHDVVNVYEVCTDCEVTIS